MQKTKKKLVAAKNWAKTHKGAIAGWTVAVMAIALQQHNLRSFYKFLDVKGIDKFEFLLAPEDYAVFKAGRK